MQPVCHTTHYTKKITRPHDNYKSNYNAAGLSYSILFRHLSFASPLFNGFALLFKVIITQHSKKIKSKNNLWF